MNTAVYLSPSHCQLTACLIRRLLNPFSTNSNQPVGFLSKRQGEGGSTAPLNTSWGLTYSAYCAGARVVSSFRSMPPLLSALPWLLTHTHTRIHSSQCHIFTLHNTTPPLTRCFFFAAAHLILMNGMMTRWSYESDVLQCRVKNPLHYLLVISLVVLAWISRFHVVILPTNESLKSNSVS